MTADPDLYAQLAKRAPQQVRTAMQKAGPIAARESLLEYVHHSFPGTYQEAPHHRMIVEHLEAVERGAIKRLMIFAPPQTGKSELVSIRFPAWLHGRHPDWGVMGFSHTASLATDFSRQVRDQISAPDWPFSGVALKYGQATVNEWGLQGRRGRHFVAGVGGGGIGKGSMVAIIDDPFKDPDEAASTEFQERIERWYWNVVRTRMAKGGRIVLMHQRWNDGDLAGRMLRDMARGGEQWTVLTFPEVAEEGLADSLGRAPGEYLWPDLRPPEETDAIRLYQAATWYPLYQQSPGSQKGGMIKRAWLRNTYNPAVLPAFVRVLIVIDSAFSVRTEADFSVAAVWGATLTDYYLIDLWRDRVAYPDLIAQIKVMYAKWAHLGPWVIIENKASGISAIQTLTAESRLPVLPYNPGTESKVSRVQGVTPTIGAGRVLLPEGAAFVADWIEEHVKFPTGKDDQVDTTAMALKLLAFGEAAWEVYDDD